MRFLWAQHSQEEDWWFLLIDERNDFNEENGKEMIWAVRHTEDGSGHFLHSKEGVTQGDPLSMISNSTWVLLSIRDLGESPPPRHPIMVCG